MVSSEGKTKILLLLYWQQLLYVLAPLTIKVSALLLYKRIFVTSRFAKFINAMLCVLGVWGVAAFLVSVFNCTPVEAFWTQQGKCIALRSWVSTCIFGSALYCFLCDFSGVCLWISKRHSRLHRLVDTSSAYLAPSTSSSSTGILDNHLYARTRVSR